MRSASTGLGLLEPVMNRQYGGAYPPGIHTRDLFMLTQRYPVPVQVPDWGASTLMGSISEVSAHRMVSHSSPSTGTIGFSPAPAQLLHSRNHAQQSQHYGSGNGLCGP